MYCLLVYEVLITVMTEYSALLIPNVAQRSHKGFTIVISHFTFLDIIKFKPQWCAVVFVWSNKSLHNNEMINGR